MGRIVVIFEKMDRIEDVIIQALIMISLFQNFVLGVQSVLGRVAQ